MENNYLTNLNVENALDKICNKDNFFDNFDKETERLIFISSNSIKFLKKNKIYKKCIILDKILK